MLHHVSIRTANIHTSIAFYECLGFEVRDRFTTGYTLACWLEGMQGRIELIQIPQPKPAPDCFGDEHYVGYYHLSFDLTMLCPNLSSWLTELATRLSATNLPELAGLPQILLSPQQQQIGDRIYEVAFINDPDRLPVELIRQL
jgi:catechol 2,3-dioxygenase-like lactoylglutathione lyase family enzyme